MGFAGVGGFDADVFEQKSNGPVRIGFSRNAIGDSVSWFPDVTIAACFSGSFESGKPATPIAAILGFGQKPFGTERIKETGQIGFKLRALKSKPVISKSAGLKWMSTRLRSKVARTIWGRMLLANMVCMNSRCDTSART
jgi:hypothetical protein